MGSDISNKVFFFLSRVIFPHITDNSQIKDGDVVENVHFLNLSSGMLRSLYLGSALDICHCPHPQFLSLLLSPFSIFLPELNSLWRPTPRNLSVFRSHQG